MLNRMLRLPTLFNTTYRPMTHSHLPESATDVDIRQVQSICKIINGSHSQTLFTEFTQNVTPMNNGTVLDITTLMNEYNMNGHELFYAMYHLSIPSGMGVFAHDQFLHKEMTLDKAKAVLEERRYYIDWYHGHGIKNHFRSSPNELQFLNKKKFDDRSYHGATFASVITLLNWKLFPAQFPLIVPEKSIKTPFRPAR